MNDIIKTCEGNLILPFGTPYIIATAWETALHYHTEAISFLDCLDHTVDISIHYQPFSKNHSAANLPSSLPKAKAMISCLDYGYQMAYNNIPRSLWNYGYKNMYKKQNWPNPNTIEINLRETKNHELVVLTHLLRRDKKAFEWVEQNTKSGLLKALMKTTKGLNIQATLVYKP